MKATLLIGALGLAAVVVQPPATPELLFRDITREAGITFEHHAAPEKRYIVESMSGGVALFDYDNDGLPDLYFVDSLTVDTANDPKAARSALYQESGERPLPGRHGQGGRRSSGLGHGRVHGGRGRRRLGRLYVTGLRGNHLYRNNHDGTFADVTERAGLSVGGWSAGCGFGDYDRDGRLDLFVSRYVKIDLAHLPEFGKDKTCEYRGIPVQCGPRGLAGRRGLPLPQRRQRTLFRRLGEGRRLGSPRLLRPRRRLVRLQRRRVAGLCTSRTTRRRTSCTSTRRTARSRIRRSRSAWRSARTAPSRAAWGSRSATTITAAASASS